MSREIKTQSPQYCECDNHMESVCDNFDDDRNGQCQICGHLEVCHLNRIEGE